MSGPARPLQGPALVELGDLPEYPLDAETRLTGHFFFTWHTDRWLNSRLRLVGAPEVRAYALDLYCLCQKQSPVGTLPDDDVQLAALLHLDLSRWQELRGRELGPLYKWRRCLAGDEVRLMHPVVTEVAMDSMRRREVHAAAASAGHERKRVMRLRGMVERAGSKRLADDEGVVEWVDEWLRRNMPEGRNRTHAWVREALEAHAIKGGSLTR